MMNEKSRNLFSKKRFYTGKQGLARRLIHLFRLLRLLVGTLIKYPVYLKRLLALLGVHMAVNSVIALYASLYVILQHIVEHTYSLIREGFVLYRHGYLYTPFGVAGHKVCGGNIYLSARTLAEYVNTAVL